MPTIVSTGQFTIVDTNDSRQMTAFISSAQAFQNAYDPSSNKYIPDWGVTATNLVMNAEVYVGSSNLVGQSTITNPKWYLSSDRVNALPNGDATNWAVENNGGTLRRKTNVASDIPLTVFFECDYTDPVTLATTHIVTSVTLSRVTIGSTSTHVELTGADVIKKPAQGKGVTAIKARLVRPSGYDDTGVTFQWFVMSPTPTQIAGDTMNATDKAKFGMKTTAPTAVPTAVIADAGGTNVPATAATWVAYNTLVISEDAVSGLQFFRVDTFDSSVPAGAPSSASGYFVIKDATDPYTVNVVSTAGDKFQNGNGSTFLYPEVYLGGNKVTDTTNWAFNWQLYDKSGNLGAFVDASKTASNTGIGISGNTAVASGDMTITLSSGTYTFAAGDTVKVVSFSTAYYFKIKTAGSATNSVTVTNDATWPVTGWTLNQLSAAGYKLFFCKGQLVTGCLVTTNGGANAGTSSDPAKILLSDYDVEAKARIQCAAVRP